MFTKRVDPRMLCMLSSAGASAAIAASAFVTSPIWFGAAMFLTGLLIAPINQTAHEFLHRYFGELFGAMNSICLLGNLVGGMVFPLFTDRLIQAYGVECAIICLAAVFLHNVPIAATLRPAKGLLNKYKSLPATEGQDGSCSDSNQDSDNDNGDEGLTGNRREYIVPAAQRMRRAKECKRSVSSSEKERDAIKELSQANVAKAVASSFKRLLHFMWVTLNIRVLYEEKLLVVMLLPCKFIVQANMVGWTLFVVSFGATHGLDESQAAILPTAGAIGGFVNQAVVTVILRFRPHWGAPLFALETASLAVAFPLYISTSSFGSLWVCSFFIGGGLFGGCPATYAILVTYVGEKNFDIMLSVQLFVTGAGGAVAGYMAGNLYDVTGSFDSVFMIMGGSSAVAFLLTLSLMLVKRMEKARTESN